MTSSSSPSTPAFSSRSWEHHVFLSFRGEDTRNNFVGHLYSALEQKGIHTYKDDEKLPRGESIGPSLMKAIEESQIAIIVFSENYADSSWCLDELAHIMKCKDTRGQIVLPIFYDVKPSDLRKQKRKFGEAFAKHELESKKKVKSWGQAFLDDPWVWLLAPREQNRKYREEFAKDELENKTKVESWRKALVDASNIAGWESKDIANRNESKFIKRIVKNISLMLHPVASGVNDNLVGIEDRMQDLKSKMQIGLGGVLMVGIWGVGGGGKTTLASSVYSEISRAFNGCCFVENVREKSSMNGLEKLQEKILFDVLKPNKVHIGGVEEGRRMIKDRLCRKKVLIVLDDVDQLDQLEALGGSRDWFCEGSLIIITTRNVHLLNVHKVDVIHHVSLLNNDEAMTLFCKHAPLGHRRIEDYERLSRDVVLYANGLPLALKVLGRFLSDKGMDEWMSALARLKEIPDTDIVGKLKISFDGLQQVEKDLFLDIACFFRGRKKDTAMKIFDACGFHPVIGVKVLIQKALITISDDGEFDMHELVQEMGHYIVKGAHPNNPEKHSRVWKMEDVLTICAMDATTEIDMIEAIRFGYNSRDLLERYKDLSPIVANTKNLRWIQWEGDLASPLLTNFPQRKLCCLLLTNSLQERLWEGYKLLPNLKIMELWGLDNLIITPDFDGLPNLERFVLARCLCLEEIHPSIGCLERLVFLSVVFCYRLKMFPPITRLKKLETLSISYCSNLFKLSENQQQNMHNLGNLHLNDNGGEVASYIKSRTNAFVICGRCGCSNLPGVECCLEEPSLPLNNMKPSLCDSNMNHIGLLFFLKDLKKLDLGFNSLGDEEMGCAVWELPNLQELNLEENKFSRLSFCHLRLPRLKFLNVANCKGLVELLELPSSIAVVVANGCTSLESFGDISNCKWLWKVSLLRGKNHGDDILLDSLLQGNAIKDYFISLVFQHQIPKGFLGRNFRGRTFTLRLPDDWYNDFCGFSICVVTLMFAPDINIVIKQEVDEDFIFESNEVVGPEYDDEAKIFVGYVSFASLIHTAFSTSSYNMISFSIEDVYSTLFAAELVPRKSKDDLVQTTNVATNSSEFWDGELDGIRPTFTIQHDSKSCIKILWRPL